jgi:hypothetical protein
VYCRISERSAQTGFVQHETARLRRRPQLRRLWAEYGSLLGVTVERWPVCRQALGLTVLEYGEGVLVPSALWATTSNL